jgi:selenocysteine lyase/cysteine desulfurase
MNVLEISASARASFYLYNDANDVDKLVKSIKKTAKILK